MAKAGRFANRARQALQLRGAERLFVRAASSVGRGSTLPNSEAPMRAMRLPASVLSALVLLSAIATPPPAAAFVNFNWAAAVSGNTDDASKWSPSGVPTSLDNVYIDLAGTYTVSFTAGTPALSTLNTNGGSAIWNVLNPTTIGSVWVANSASPSFQAGQIVTQYLELGNGGSPTLTLTRQSSFGPAGVFRSAGISHPAGNGDEIGAFGAVATLNVFGGGLYETGYNTTAPWGLVIGPQANTTGIVSVAGSYTLPTTYSRLHAIGTAPIKVGFTGTGTLNVNNGGICDAENDVIVAEVTGSNGTLKVGNTGTGIGTPRLNVGNNLGIGRGVFAVAAGVATMEVSTPGIVRVAGRTDVGSEGGDQGCTLRMQEGGTLVASGGLYVKPTSGAGLDLRGGVVHVNGGAFQYPANRLLNVTSHVGNPQLWISNHGSNTGPSQPASISQLFVGRGGTGIMRVTGSGTVLALGLGATAVGDSLGGIGNVVVDSAGTIASTGQIAVGTSGSGVVEVRGGARANFTTTFLGAAATGNGRITVTGPGSVFHAVQDVYVGGGINGDAGTGTVEIDSSGTFELVSNGGINTPLVRIFPTAGQLAISNGGLLTTPGGVSNQGSTVLSNGTVDALYFSQPPTGRLSGWGAFTGHLQNNGLVSPSSLGDNFGAFRVGNQFWNFTVGHYHVDLGPHVGRRCDTLVVTNTANLDGTLDLATDASFVRVTGDTFTVMTYGARIGTFATVTWNGTPLGGRAQVVYGPNAVWVIMTGTTGVDDGPNTAVSDLRLAPVSVRGGAAFELALPRDAQARVKLYDVTGRLVATLADGALVAGRHTLAAPEAVARLGSGVLFARAEVRDDSGVRVLTARTTLLR